VNLESGETATVDLRVAEPLTRAFVVVDGFGAPVEGASAAVQLRSDQSTVGYGFSQSTDAAGGLTVSMVPPGFETTVKFNKTGFIEAASTAVTGSGGEVYPEESIVMYQRAGITAMLIDGEGAPLADRDVLIVVSYGDQRELRVPAYADANGTLTVASELPATETSLEFQTTQDRNGVQVPAIIQRGPVTLRAGEIENLGEVAAPAGAQ
jgi:hypothetical protein